MNSTEENTMLNLGLKLGENLKKFRLQRELTQEQLADVLGSEPLGERNDLSRYNAIADYCELL